MQEQSQQAGTCHLLLLLLLQFQVVQCSQLHLDIMARNLLIQANLCLLIFRIILIRNEKKLEAQILKVDMDKDIQ